MPKAIISVKEARKLLGKDAKGLDDHQIMVVITTLQELTRAGLKIAMSSHITEVIESDCGKHDNK